jgi:hypothetical protein
MTTESASGGIGKTSNESKRNPIKLGSICGRLLTFNEEFSGTLEFEQLPPLSLRGAGVIKIGNGEAPTPSQESRKRWGLLVIVALGGKVGTRPMGAWHASISVATMPVVTISVVTIPVLIIVISLMTLLTLRFKHLISVHRCTKRRLAASNNEHSAPMGMDASLSPRGRHGSGRRPGVIADVEHLVHAQRRTTSKPTDGKHVIPASLSSYKTGAACRHRCPQCPGVDSRVIFIDFVGEVAGPVTPAEDKDLAFVPDGGKIGAMGWQ